MLLKKLLIMVELINNGKKELLVFSRICGGGIVCIGKYLGGQHEGGLGSRDSLLVAQKSPPESIVNTANDASHYDSPNVGDYFLLDFNNLTTF